MYLGKTKENKCYIKHHLTPINIASYQFLIILPLPSFIFGLQQICCIFVVNLI